MSGSEAVKKQRDSLLLETCLSGLQLARSARMQSSDDQHAIVWSANQERYRPRAGAADQLLRNSPLPMIGRPDDHLGVMKSLSQRGRPVFDEAPS